MNRRNFLQMTTASTLTSMLLLGGCGNPLDRWLQPAEDAPIYQEKGLLRFAFGQPPETFDPALATNDAEYYICFLTHDALVWVDHKLEPQPSLAESWQSNEDFTEWTFSLRQDVLFHHDELPLLAEDVVYSFERILDSNTGSPLRSTLSFISQIKAVDDYTVQFILKEPKLDMPILLGTPQARIVSKKYEPQFLPQKPSGTGLFQFESYIQGELLTLTYNPNYWWDVEAEPIEIVECHYISSLEQQIEALKNDEIDVIPNLSFAQADQLEEAPEIIVKEIASGAHLTIVMRPDEPPFDNPLVRQAMKHSLDREIIREEILDGHGEVANDHPIPSSSSFWHDLPQRNYDIEQARLLLEEAGYPNGIKLDLITSNVSPGMVQLAQLFKEMAEPAGIEITVTQVSPDIFWTDYWNQHAPFFMSSWAFRPSIDESLRIAYHSGAKWNESQWHTPELDELLDNAGSESDHDRRVELYQNAQEIISNDGAVIIPYFRPILIAMNKRVSGLDPHPANWIYPATVRLLVE